MHFDREANQRRVPLSRELTPRERAIIELLDQRMSRKQIAHALGIAVNTVNAHITHIAEVVPGNLPPIGRIVAWYRGASEPVLNGSQQLSLAEV